MNYLGYKFSGVDKYQLKEELTLISKIIEEKFEDIFICFRDFQNWGEKDYSGNEIINKVFDVITKSNNVFIYLNSNEKSEGMLIEVGYAKALGKNIILLKKEGVQSYFLEKIVNKIIEFKYLDDLRNKL